MLFLINPPNLETSEQVLMILSPTNPTESVSESWSFSLSVAQAPLCLFLILPWLDTLLLTRLFIDCPLSLYTKNWVYPLHCYQNSMSKTCDYTYTFLCKYPFIASHYLEQKESLLTLVLGDLKCSWRSVRSRIILISYTNAISPSV